MADNTKQFRWIVTIQRGLDFALERGALQLYRPDGERFATYVELMEQREQECQRAERLAARLRGWV
jgi:hypothetical protein